MPEVLLASTILAGVERRYSATYFVLRCTARAGACHAGASLKTALSDAAGVCQSRLGDSVSQPVRTARGSHPQQPQRQLTGHRDAIREIRKERCGRRFRGGVPFSFRLSQRISFRWFLSHSTGTHLTYTSHPSLPNAPALVAPRTLCRDSNSRCPTEARRVLASVI